LKISPVTDSEVHYLKYILAWKCKNLWYFKQSRIWCCGPCTNRDNTYIA